MCKDSLEAFLVQACKSGGGWKGLEHVKQVLVLVAALQCQNDVYKLALLYIISSVLSLCSVVK